jgi:hypothetical protein
MEALSREMSIFHAEAAEGAEVILSDVGGAIRSSGAPEFRVWEYD